MTGCSYDLALMSAHCTCQVRDHLTIIAMSHFSKSDHNCIRTMCSLPVILSSFTYISHEFCNFRLSNTVPIIKNKETTLAPRQAPAMVSETQWTSPSTRALIVDNVAKGHRNDPFFTADLANFCSPGLFRMPSRASVSFSLSRLSMISSIQGRIAKSSIPMMNVTAYKYRCQQR